MLREPSRPAEFDRYASRYEALVAASIGASGEGPEYFAAYKLSALRRSALPAHARVLDYGCGIGHLTQLLAEEYHAVHAFDPSPACLARARERAPAATFHSSDEELPEAYFDAVVVACVLHHVAPTSRANLVCRLASRLKPGGRLFVYEHNPLNPLTRRAVAQCEFDEDAILLWPGELRQLMRRAGMREVRLDYIVFFPRALAWLRRFEAQLRAVPLGAQTLTVATRAPDRAFR